MYNIGVIGSGSFGTALSVLLSGKGYNVKMTGRNKEDLLKINDRKMNDKYLPGVWLPEALDICIEEEEVVSESDIVVYAVPSQSFEDVFKSNLKWLKDDVIVVNVAKGIDEKKLKTLSQVAASIKPDIRYVALSGPSHAEEVGRNLPTTVTVAGRKPEDAKFVQSIFMTDRFRVYTNEDLLGVELGGALKNIMALGAGISDGAGFGDNAKAALMTRGITEITRLGVVMGAQEATFSGLSGIGDLIVTCTSMHSRNRRCGMLIGEGVKPEDAIARVGMVVEGIYTCKAAYKLSRKLNVEMPITEAIYSCISGTITTEDAISMLMARSAKGESNAEYLGTYKE